MTRETITAIKCTAWGLVIIALLALIMYELDTQFAEALQRNQSLGWSASDQRIIQSESSELEGPPAPDPMEHLRLPECDFDLVGMRPYHWDDRVVVSGGIIWIPGRIDRKMNAYRLPC